MIRTHDTFQNGLEKYFNTFQTSLEKYLTRISATNPDTFQNGLEKYTFQTRFEK